MHFIELIPALVQGSDGGHCGHGTKKSKKSCKSKKTKSRTRSHGGCGCH